MTNIVLRNPYDRQLARGGGMRPDQVRALTVEALVDTGATTLAIPANVVEALGLAEVTRRRVRMANGVVEELSVVSAVVEILGRECYCEAFVLPAGTTPLIGQVPLELLDLIVDPRSREVAVNPAHPDAPLLDLLRAS